MSAFSPQPGNKKPKNNLEFVTQREAAALLAVSTRTVRRYLCDPQVREILGAVYHRGRWRIPRSSFAQPWRRAEITERLAKIGKGGENSVKARWRHETGMGNLRLEREAKILRQALELERRVHRRRLTKRAKYEIEEVWKRAQSVASKYRCSIFNAPKFYERYLTAQNHKEKQHNATQIRWLKSHDVWNPVNPEYSARLKRQGFWASAKELINSGEDYTEGKDKGGVMHRPFFPKGSGHFEAVIECQDADGQSHNFLLPNSFTEGNNLEVTCIDVRPIHLFPVKTKAQIAREIREFLKHWPSRKSIDAAKQNYKRSRELLDLKRAVAECGRQKKPWTAENLLKYLYLDEIAQWQGRPGISRSTFFRRYSKQDIALVCRSKIGRDAQHLPNRKTGGVRDGFALDYDDLKNMTLQTEQGWELSNPCRGEE